MLQLFTDGQPTDLSDDISIDLVFENPLFSTDRIPASYSLSYDLPLTPKNRQLSETPTASPPPATAFGSAPRGSFSPASRSPVVFRPSKRSPTSLP